MHLQDSHKFVSQAIETIVARGGQKLYERYLKTKIPNHATQQITDILIRSFNTPYSNAAKANTISKQVTPQGFLKETLIPNKINKSCAQQGMPMNMITALSFKNQVFTSNSPSNKIRRKQIIGSKTERPLVNKSQVYKSLLNAEQKGEESAQVRKQKQKSIANQQKLKNHQQQQQKQKSFRRRSLQRRFEQFQVHGIPYAYDQQGNIIAPSIKQHKNNLFLNAIQQKRGNRMLNIKYQTLDLTSSQRYSIEDVKHIVGKKRGFTSSKFYKKLKMTNQEFNNQNSRQNSNIPYLNLNEGIKIIQRERNVVAEKRRKNNLSKDQFKQKTQQNFFKSFMPDFDMSSMQTMSVDRPYTTAQMNRTKRTSQTINTQKLQSSILWRPRTTSKNCRVKINDQELVKTIVQIE